jgi:hypothetical protein
MVNVERGATFSILQSNIHHSGCPCFSGLLSRSLQPAPGACSLQPEARSPKPGARSPEPGASHLWPRCLKRLQAHRAKLYGSPGRLRAPAGFLRQSRRMSGPSVARLLVPAGVLLPRGRRRWSVVLAACSSGERAGSGTTRPTKPNDRHSGVAPAVPAPDARRSPATADPPTRRFGAGRVDERGGDAWKPLNARNVGVSHP